MPYQLAHQIFSLIRLYFIYRDNCYNDGFASGKNVQKKLDQKRNGWQKELLLENIQQKSKESLSTYTEKMNSMFKTSQRRVVKCFLRDLYESKEDAMQQLYFVLSLTFVEKKHFLQLIRARKKRKNLGENIDKFWHDAYYHAIECGDLGAPSVQELRTRKMQWIDGKRVKVNHIREKHNIKKLDFLNMHIKEVDIPFVEFKDNGLRFCTPEIKTEIDAILGKPYFENYLSLDVTPVSLYFICLINVAKIPEIESAFANTPFEAKIAKRIYPKLWKAWRENRIKELIFLGSNNWTSDQCDNARPGWFREAWAPMKQCAPYISTHYIRGNFVNGVTKKVIKGAGKMCSLVHCQRHENVLVDI